MYPAAIQAPLPSVGPLLGEDRTAGRAPLCWDPFEVYAHGALVTNPNVFVMGEPGFGKSSLIKCWLVWQHYLYGDRWVTITDPKGEYRPIAEMMGMSVLRLAPGGTACVNPLELPSGLSATQRREEADVQTTMLQSLSATQLARPLTQLERKTIRMIVGVTIEVSSSGSSSSPTLRDVVGLLTAPTGEMCDAVRRSDSELVRDVEELRFALDELCTGTLRGMFDGASSVSVDWDAPGMVMDLSGVLHDRLAMALVMVAAISWSRQQRGRLQGRQRININDESYYQYRQVETVEFAQERRKIGRHFGEANIDICHRPSDLEAQADDGSSVAKMAVGLLSDSSMKIIFRQAAGELDGATNMFDLSVSEQVAVRSLKRARAVWKIGDWSLIAQHYRPDHLQTVTDTDQFMRRDSLLGVDEFAETAA